MEKKYFLSPEEAYGLVQSGLLADEEIFGLPVAASLEIACDRGEKIIVIVTAFSSSMVIFGEYVPLKHRKTVKYLKRNCFKER